MSRLLATWRLVVLSWLLIGQQVQPSSDHLVQVTVMPEVPFPFIPPRQCGNVTALERVEIGFKTGVVEHEYIVTFNGYFTPTARKNFIQAALREAEIPSWQIVPRNNPASDYPSDFEVVLLQERAQDGRDALEDHPNVKRVTPQRRVRRTLKRIAGDSDHVRCGDVPSRATVEPIDSAQRAKFATCSRPNIAEEWTPGGRPDP
ncbi:Membrane-bound transcription factor site-1 protease [Branchiostoma belcheri]|nr:Membrane-bound transcription factor site-1 protease [Branchiostoma belcheri]